MVSPCFLLQLEPKHAFACSSSTLTQTTALSREDNVTLRTEWKNTQLSVASKSISAWRTAPQHSYFSCRVKRRDVGVCCICIRTHCLRLKLDVLGIARQIQIYTHTQVIVILCETRRLLQRIKCDTSMSIAKQRSSHVPVGSASCPLFSANCTNFARFASRRRIK